MVHKKILNIKIKKNKKKREQNQQPRWTKKYRKKNNDRARGVEVEHRSSTPGVLGSIPGATKNLDTADCVVIYSVNHLKTQLVFTYPLKLVPALKSGGYLPVNIHLDLPRHSYN